MEAKKREHAGIAKERLQLERKAKKKQAELEKKVSRYVNREFTTWLCGQN